MCNINVGKERVHAKLTWLVEKTVSAMRIINTLLGIKKKKHYFVHLTTKSTKENRHRYTTQFRLFFFHWHYNPRWVLAFSVILFHSALSLHCFLHPFIPIIWMSSSISTIHLFLGLPLILVPIGFHSKIFLGVPLSSMRITWPRRNYPLI